MTVANISANKISTIPRHCHRAAITQMVMDGLRCPLGNTTWSERSLWPRLFVLLKVVGTAKVTKSNLHNFWHRGRVMGLIYFPKVLCLLVLACASYRRKKIVKIVSNSKSY